MRTVVEPRALAGYLIALVILCAVGAVSYRTTLQIDRDAEGVRHGQEVLARLAELLSTVTDVESGQRGYLITGDEIFLEPYRQALQRVEREFSDLRRLTSDYPEQQRLLKELEPVVNRRLEWSRRGIDLRQREGFEAARKETAAGEGKGLQDQIRHLVAELSAFEQGSLDKRIRQRKAALRSTQVIIIGGSMLALVLVAYSFARMLRHRSARQEAEAALRAANEQLERRVAERTKEVLKANETLRESDQRFRLALHNAPVSVAVQDRDLRYIWAYGQRTASPGEIIGKLDSEIFRPEEAAHFTARKRRVLEENIELREQMWLARPSGRIFLDLYWAPIHDEAGRVIGVGTTTVDLTPIKFAEEKLLLSQAKLQAAMESMTDAVFISDTEGRFVDFNHAFATFHKFRDKEQCAGTLAEHPGFLDVYTADGQLAPLEQWAVPRALRGETVSNAEYSLRRRDTGEAWVGSYSFAPIRDKEGKITGAVVVGRDVTEQKLAQEALRQRNDELVRFNYTVSHDLKSPLVTIRTFLGFLEQDLRRKDQARVEADLGHMRRAGEKMTQLLEELLELSRIGHKVNPHEEFPLQPLVEEAMDMVAGAMAERRVQVKVTDAPLILRGDRRRLLEVYQNLIDNAVKFMGGQPAPRVEVGVEQRGHETVLFVRDNGVGIDPRHKEKLFGLFEKLHPDTPGTGIGLAMVKRIVEVHGGRIWAESAGPGQGAAFYFTLSHIRQA